MNARMNDSDCYIPFCVLNIHLYPYTYLIYPAVPSLLPQIAEVDPLLSLQTQLWNKIMCPQNCVFFFIYDYHMEQFSYLNVKSTENYNFALRLLHCTLRLVKSTLQPKPIMTWWHALILLWFKKIFVLKFFHPVWLLSPFVSGCVSLGES